MSSSSVVADVVADGKSRRRKKGKKVLSNALVNGAALVANSDSDNRYYDSDSMVVSSISSIGTESSVGTSLASTSASALTLVSKPVVNDSRRARKNLRKKGGPEFVVENRLANDNGTPVHERLQSDEGSPLCDRVKSCKGISHVPETLASTSSTLVSKPAVKDSRRARKNPRKKGGPESVVENRLANNNGTPVHERLQSDEGSPVCDRVKSDKGIPRVRERVQPKGRSFRQRNTDNSFGGSNEISSVQADELTDTIIIGLRNESLDCQVCCDIIKRRHETWGCDNCYSVFHLRCVSKWARSSTTRKSIGEVGWRCPSCQFRRQKIPSTYMCFCGATRNPHFNPHTTPHTCGELCQKKRFDEHCKHPCTLLCHPGRCPPCSSMAPLQTCYCGKLSYRVRCIEATSRRFCESECGDLLACGLHKCTKICHAGPCEACEIKEEARCYCGRETRTQSCGGELTYSCSVPCGRKLDCDGDHICERRCHDGPCGPCPLGPDVVTSCPCGKISLELLLGSDLKCRSSCADIVPTCPNICGRILPCASHGEHRCAERCHSGPCRPCDAIVTAHCRCTRSSRKVACADIIGKCASEWKCEKQCRIKRLCGRHVCNLLCCPLPPEAHECELRCQRELPCGNHRCGDFCHRGNCRRCLEATFEDVTCRCGRTRYEPPVPCGTKPPQCELLCSRTHSCDHEVLHPCHDLDDCPPCPVLVDALCLCRRFTYKVPCHVKKPKCGTICDLLLSCGHPCPRICHAPPCQDDSGCTFSVSSLPSIRRPTAAPLNEDGSIDAWNDEININTPGKGEEPSRNIIVSCGQRCNRPHKDCGHACSRPCHPSLDCSDSPCTERVPIRCSCNRRSAFVDCLSGSVYDAMSISNKAESVKLTKRVLECDAECAIQYRNRHFAQAIGLSNVRVDSGPKLEYSDDIITMARSDAKFLLRVEDLLASFIASGKNSQLLPCMQRGNRRLVHELAPYYGVLTESFDAEPKRSIQLRRLPGRLPSQPTMLLSAAANIDMVVSVVRETCDFHPSSSKARKAKANWFADLRSVTNDSEENDDEVKTITNTLVSENVKEQDNIKNGSGLDNWEDIIDQ